MQIKPIQEVAVPEQTVLRFEHPVRLIREVEVAGIQSAHLGGVVGGHTLGSHNAEVELTVNNTDRRIPFINIQMR